MFGRKKPPRGFRKIPPWLGRLTLVAVLIDFIATLSYGTSAHVVVRFMNPQFGAWWNHTEFAFLQSAAAAVGVLCAVRLGARLVDGTWQGNRSKRFSMIAAVIAGALAMPPIERVSGQLARFRWSSGGAPRAFLVDRFDYNVGMFLDKLLNAGLYSFKMSVFAFPIGLILFGLAMAAFMTVEPTTVPSQATSK